VIGVPTLLNSYEMGLSQSAIYCYSVVALISISLYFYIACTNPGFLIGSGQDVERRAGAYDPKHYQIDSERKQKPGAAQDENDFAKNPHTRKISLLTLNLAKK
jgi:hypothetical protein